MQSEDKTMDVILLKIGQESESNAIKWHKRRDKAKRKKEERRKKKKW